MRKAQDVCCIINKKETEAPDRNKIMSQLRVSIGHVQEIDSIKGIASCEMLLCGCLAVRCLSSSLFRFHQ